MAASTSTAVPARSQVRVRTALLPPALGALGGLLLGLAVEAVAAASTTFDGVLSRAAYVGEPVGLVVATVLGLALGVLVAATLREEILRVVVTDHRIVMTWGDARVAVPRSLVRAVVVDGDLVLIGAGTVELARVRCDVDAAHLSRALHRHGYPAPLTEDPSAAAFRAWPTPEVTASGAPTAAAALTSESRRLLDARDRALTEQSHGDAELLRRQLTARGVMVRDIRPFARRPEQQWRSVATSTPQVPVQGPAVSIVPEVPAPETGADVAPERLVGASLAAPVGVPPRTPVGVPPPVDLEPDAAATVRPGAAPAV